MDGLTCLSDLCVNAGAPDAAAIGDGGSSAGTDTGVQAGSDAGALLDGGIHPGADASVPQSGINAKNFTVTCEHGSIAGFEQDGLEMTCTVHGSDLNGAFVPNSKVIFKTEAGGVPASADFARDGATGGGIATFTYRTQCKWPKDVPAVGSEPSHPCVFNNKCKMPVPGNENRTCNPRDGLATLVAITAGSEAFVDLNGNGTWDTGEHYDDLGEPFVDANDNGVHDSDEEFDDTNGNGTWDGPNGKWDASTTIWTSTKILWTGAVDGTQSSILPATGATFDHCVAQTYTLKIFDINGNAPAACGSNDQVTVSPSGNVKVVHVSNYYDSATTPASGEQQGIVLVDVQDAHPCPDCPTCSQDTFTLDFTLDRVLDGLGTQEPSPALGTRAGSYK